MQSLNNSKSSNIFKRLLNAALHSPTFYFSLMKVGERSKSHYIPNISNLLNKLLERNFPWKLPPIKNSTQFPLRWVCQIQRNGNCVPFLKIFTSFFNIQIFNVLNVMFLRSVWKSGHGNCVNQSELKQFPWCNFQTERNISLWQGHSVYESWRGYEVTIQIYPLLLPSYITKSHVIGHSNRDHATSSERFTT